MNKIKLPKKLNAIRSKRTATRKGVKKMKALHMIAFVLLVVGGLNWLLVGLFKWDVGMLFGGQAALVSRVVYVLVGLAALWEVFTHKANCKACTSTPAPVKPMGM